MALVTTSVAESQRPGGQDQFFVVHFGLSERDSLERSGEEEWESTVERLGVKAKEFMVAMADV